MKWSKEERYRKLEEVNEKDYEELVENVNNCQYRQTFHIQPKTGLLNDPNGFSFYQGEYHLFYQWFPLGPVHGVKYWYHMSSKDLVYWEDKGIGLSPDTKYDSHGVFSGSGFVKKDLLYLFYTGNTRNAEWLRTPYQCLAIMDKTGKIEKYDQPLIIDYPKGYTSNFRDPKVFEQANHYYCLIGAENQHNEGKIVYYQSEDLFDWKFKGEIAIPYKGGFMWECPDYFELEEKGVILFCAQGQEKQGNKFNNVYPSGYILSEKVDFTCPVVTSDKYVELDRGFDFYAAQTMQDELGRRILIGWLGLPGIECVTEDNAWAHCLTLPRELTIKNDKLYQAPIKELNKLKYNERQREVSFKGEKSFKNFKGKCYYLECEFKKIEGQKVGVKLRVGNDESIVFYYNKRECELVFDRSCSGKLYAQEYGQIRKCFFDEDELKLEIYVDQSSIEVFVNDGLEVFTSRIYANKENQGIKFFSDDNVYLCTKICDIKL